MTFDDDDVDLASKTTVFQGFYRVDRYDVRYRRFDGDWSPEIRREVFERGHVVAVVLYDPAIERLVMIEQFRPGALAAGWHPWLVEIVAGGVEDGESAADVARREALEEADCRVLDLVPMCRFLAIPAACSETTEMFCGLVDASGVGGLHGLDSEGEDIRATAVPVEQAMDWLDSGAIVNARTIIGLQWFRTHRAAYRERWRDRDR